MRHVTASVAQQDFDGLLDNVINLGEPVSISADNGSAILISQDEWTNMLEHPEELSGLMETLYLQSIPGMVESIKEARATPISECLDDIGWDIN